MKNRRIEAKVGRTINTGDYESYRVDAGLACDIEDDEVLNEAFHRLFTEVGKQLLVNSDGVKRDEREPKPNSGGSRFRGRG